MRLLGLAYFGGVQLTGANLPKTRVREVEAVDFKATGDPVPLGRRAPRRRFGKVVDYGPAKGATLIVGLNKGRKAVNRMGVCRAKPSTFVQDFADDQLIALRAAQVGKENVGATRVRGRGWYAGAPEKSASYQLVYIPNAVEKTYAQFKRNVERLAERMGETLCQDEVLVVHDDSDRRRTKSAVR